MTRQRAVGAAERSEVARLCTEHGVHGQIHVAKPFSGDELVIVLCPEQASALRAEAELIRQLMDMLHRKVWIVEYSAAFAGVTVPL